MAGVGKLLKQAQKMQKQMQEVQESLAETVIKVSSGGGAIEIEISGQSEFKSITIDPEFLKEDAEFVQETLLAAIQEATQKAKEKNEAMMSSISTGLGGMPGLF
jgi:DNA-binding YbaB/EbfC family protein